MADLGLQIRANTHFDFLVSEWGYKRSESNAYLVRFESSTVNIDVVFDGDRSYELGLLVSQKGAVDPPFNIDEILRLRNAPEAKTFALIQVTTEDALATWMKKLAEVLRTYGDDFIAGNEDSFAEIERQRNKEVQAYAMELKLEAARSSAAIAWHRKDYAGVIAALEPIRESLSPAECAKLKFAEEHRAR